MSDEKRRDELTPFYMQILIEIPSDEKRHDNKVLFIYKHSYAG